MRRVLPDQVDEQRRGRRACSILVIPAVWLGRPCCPTGRTRSSHPRLCRRWRREEVLLDVDDRERLALAWAWRPVVHGDDLPAGVEQRRPRAAVVDVAIVIAGPFRTHPCEPGAHQRWLGGPALDLLNGAPRMVDDERLLAARGRRAPRHRRSPRARQEGPRPARSSSRGPAAISPGARLTAASQDPGSL